MSAIGALAAGNPRSPGRLGEGRQSRGDGSGGEQGGKRPPPILSLGKGRVGEDGGQEPDSLPASGPISPLAPATSVGGRRTARAPGRARQHRAAAATSTRALSPHGSPQGRRVEQPRGRGGRGTRREQQTGRSFKNFDKGGLLRTLISLLVL